MRLPAFIARQMVVSGSLRATPDGFTLQARNPFGEGALTRIGRIVVDGEPVDPAAIEAVRVGDPAIYRATEVSPATPVLLRKGDLVTFHVRGPIPGPGFHRLEVEVTERTMGTIVVEVEEPLAG